MSERERPNTKKLVRAAAEQLGDLVGRPVERASGFERDGEGWRVMLEVEEMSRIPESTSLMASYEAIVADDGTLLEYGRVRRYYRNQADDE
jgi:hypothetical protein